MTHHRGYSSSNRQWSWLPLKSIHYYIHALNKLSKEQEFDKLKCLNVCMLFVVICGLGKRRIFMDMNKVLK